MEHSKLSELLKTFESTEWRAFRDYVGSPYFNKQEVLIRFCDYLKQAAAKDYPASKLDRHNVYSAIYPEQTYDDKQFNYLLSGLLKLAEDFIALRQFEQDGIMPEYYLLKACLHRRQEKSYKHIFQKAQEKLENWPWRNAHYQFQAYLLAETAEQHFTIQNIRRFDHQLQDAADKFDAYFLSQKLYFHCAMLDRQKIVPEPYRLTMENELSDLIDHPQWDRMPAVNTYKKLLYALKDKEKGHNFSQFSQLLEENAQLFPAEEMRDLYFYAINYCIHQIRLGEKSFADNLMRLYEQGLTREYLLEDGRLSPWTFKNMVKLGLGLQRFDWVEKFVAEYSNRLPEERRSDAFHFNMADLYYHKGVLDKAMEHLYQVAYSDIHYSIGAKAMLLKIYYEKQETEAFWALQASFKVFLQRNKLISKEVKAPYVNFARLLYQMQKYGSRQKQELTDAIENTPMLADRSWLAQQVGRFTASENSSK